MNKVTKQLVKDAQNVLDTKDRVGAMSVLERLVLALAEDEDPPKKWWVILLKTLAYLIGLLLAGIGTAEAATMVMH